MEINRLIVFTILAGTVFVSGCTEDIDDLAGDNTQSSGSDLDSFDQNRGLEVSELSVLNDQITAIDGSATTVELTLQNYNQEPVEIEELSLENTAMLNVESRTCTPSNIEDREVQEAVQDQIPEVFCEWRISAPSEDDFGRFEERSFNPNVYLEYKGKLSNQESFSIDFQRQEDIREMSEERLTVNNGEIEMIKQLSQNPVPTSEDSSNRQLEYQVSNSGPGSLGELDNGEEFRLSLEPQNLFYGDCSSGEVEESITIGNSLDVSCPIGSSSEATRNIFTDVEYNYIKTPSFSILVESD